MAKLDRIKISKVNTHETIRHKLRNILYLIHTFILKSIWKPLAADANLLKTSKCWPNILFDNILTSLFWLPCLLNLSNSLLNSIMNIIPSLVFL